MGHPRKIETIHEHRGDIRIAGAGRKLVSIVIPAWNEEAVIEQLGIRLKALMERHPQYNYEVIVVENGSHDRSFQALLELHRNDPRFKIVQLSRNFTADGGVAAGLQFCAGDCAVLMDADLQDPPEVIDTFFKKWEEGNEVVYGIIKSREGVSPLRKLLNGIFYKIINKLTNGSVPENVTAFRLMDRVVYQELNHMPERNRFTRGLCSWIGFRQVGVEFERADRFAGESKSPFTDILKEATYAIFSFSFVPVRFVTFIGLALSAFSFIFLAVQICIALTYGQTVPGYRTIMMTMLLMFGFVFIALGIMGEYISLIFDEAKARPLFIVRRSVGFEEEHCN